MARDIKINIQYPINEKEVVKFDYCKPVVDRIVDEIKSKAKNEKKAKYSQNIKRIIKGCAPTQIELREYAEQIIQYYIDNFSILDLGYDDVSMKLEIITHKYELDPYGVHLGKIIRKDDIHNVSIYINYMTILNNMIQNEYNTSKLDKEYYCVSIWKDKTKNKFLLNLRYEMAREICSWMQAYEFSKKGITIISDHGKLLGKILAEYFAFCYINEFIYSVGIDEEKLDYTFGKDYKKGKIKYGFLEAAHKFTNDPYGDMRDSAHYGGELLAALAIKDGCENFGNKYDFYRKLYEDFLKEEYRKGIQRLIDRKGEI